MKGRRTGSRIFMTELMFSILYFIIIAAVCVECFAGSYAMSRTAAEETRAVNIASNVAERFYGTDAMGDFVDYYDGNWCSTDASNASYEVKGIESSNVGKHSLIKSMSISVTRLSDNSEIYALNIKKAVGLED